ncbi:MAG: phosphotransferase [Deltaproteobacteria bacterium]|nr:phosphotransferase [Deltaproteobacteria bacterium]
MEVAATPPQEMSALVAAVVQGDCIKVDLLAGQASTRRYYRVRTTGRPTSVVVMVVPPEDRALEPAAYPFLNVHAYLHGHRYPVPQVLRQDLAGGMIVLEDLGDETLELAFRARPPSQSHSLYAAAVSLIGALQKLPPDPDCLAFGRRFDFKLLRWELDHFRQWLLQEGRGIQLNGSDSAAVESAFDRMATELAAAPQVLVHRDFQSRNLMVESSGQIRVIDFQDALMGSQVYDLVALLRDSYVPLDNTQVFNFIDNFSVQWGLELDQTRRLFHLQTAQRKLKDAGRFVFIDRQRGNPNFLPSIPLSLSYVGHALANLPDYKDLHQVLARHVPELNV